ncbi:MAG TPA: hypothetical protein VNE19_00660 [Methylomirabilota bacterium]|nr:hypothetical protein [Methylomirabilota bacterium]
MEFLFVLPVPGSSFRDSDEVAHLRDRVSAALGASGTVDRHDAGAGETDFLILTTTPLAAYDALEGFGDFDARPELRAAYRRLENEDYEVYQRQASFHFHIA